MKGYEVQPDARLRENLAQCDRSSCEKVMSLPEAASFVQERMTVDDVAHAYGDAAGAYQPKPQGI